VARAAERAHVKRPRWLPIVVALAVVTIGIALRTIALDHMEYKEDEEYNFAWSQLIGKTQPWPAHGMPSGVYVPNPGMSVWTFAGLAKVVGAHDPVDLMRALAIFAVLGIALCGALARFSARPRDWLWVAALGLVNPIQVLYQRKLWPEPFLPVFVALTLMGWWARDRRASAAIAWGLLGALLGQIHMSGFFFAAALWVTTLYYDRERARAWFGAWFFGSCLGAAPLLPWAWHALNLPTHPAIAGGSNEILQFKYWVFLLSNPLGLHVGNALGLLRGASHVTQLADFARYPLLSEGRATWLVGVAHALLVGTGFAVAARAFLAWARTKTTGPVSPERILLVATVLVAGVLMTLPSFQIRRYYLMVCFPVDALLLVRAARAAFPRASDRVLTVVWAAQLLISASFSAYVVHNQGSSQGDYGRAYVVEMRSRVPYGPPAPQGF
jgi:4-amino-4-deoxy-L-arabinose transferase-like glycosyltransferase